MARGVSSGVHAIEASSQVHRRTASALWRFCRRKPLGAIGGFIVLLMVVVALFAPLLAPRDPYEMDIGIALTPPGLGNLLGTDQLGRDVLSRVIYGSRVSLIVGLLCTILGQVSGGLLGSISGYFGRRVDFVVQRIMDVLMAIPMIVLALTIMALLGSSVTNVIIAIGIVQAPRAARTMRSAALKVRGMQYIEAAKSIGCTEWYILFRHVMPNCIAPFLIIATVAVGQAILTEATLSFLGAGSPPPTPSWGLMLSSEGRGHVEQAPWLAIFPGIAISLVVFGFNLLGDALRDILDPRLRLS